ncbi:NAD-aldehyde dehydrogenase [Trametes versicolor FP-101664 SS1]|uniref:Aldehyde dehydrogenase n=1 Tax=Trametes versicolor (strain FP-101664) TaxID=717944 RepID=R7S7S2_TRAVS|nr:NAD-aldehyde dehydrogenase [Trametes versicolor FP-101664 SS1]EIW52056.1 NAD-aldehyde dehydrogenase [Trametes versicolor FP-101664 SS1]
MSVFTYTPVEDIPKIHERARQAYRTGKTKSVAFRKEQIAQLGYLLKDNEQNFIDALKQDLGRPSLETMFFDFAAVYVEVRTAYDNVEKWTKPQKAEFSFNFFAMSPKLRAEPKGTILIIGPFNVPVFTILSPLVGAMAGGNAAVLKPSEQTPAYSALLAELFPQYLDNDLYHVINGGIPETTQILELQWNHSTEGNGRVGCIIAQAAAKHLTPLTLEVTRRDKFCAGKNPVVVDPKCDLKVAARRILWGRFSNAGQICLAPEYVLVPERFQDELVEAMKEVYESFYPDGPEKSDSYSRIVSEAHTARIKRLIDESAGAIVFGGAADVSQKYIAPTLVKDVKSNDALMQEEIFGPVLPVIPVKSIDDAIAFINERDHPLAVYVFSADKAFQNKVFDNTESGAAVVNETLISCGVPGLPMGGVGASGYGYYTGKHMFDEFTHLRVSIDNPGWVDKVAFGFRYPPYKPNSLKQMQALSPTLPSKPGKCPSHLASGKRWGFWLGFVLIGVASLVLTGPALSLLSQSKA